MKSAVDASQDIIEKATDPEVLVFPSSFVTEVTGTLSSPVDINGLSFRVITRFMHAVASDHNHA